MIYVLDLVNYKQRIYDALIGDYFAVSSIVWMKAPRGFAPRG